MSLGLPSGRRTNGITIRSTFRSCDLFTWCSAHTMLTIKKAVPNLGKTHLVCLPKLRTCGQCAQDFSKKGFVTPMTSPALGGSLLTSIVRSLSCIVRYGRMSLARGIWRRMRAPKNVISTEVGPTGRMRSLSHHTAWLVCVGDCPNTSIGSQSMRHSQMDHKFDKHASKSNNGGG